MAAQLALVLAVVSAAAAGAVRVPAAPARADAPAQVSISPALRQALLAALPGLTRAQQQLFLNAASRLRAARQRRLLRSLRRLSRSDAQTGSALLRAALAGRTRAQQRALADTLLGASTRADRRLVAAVDRHDRSALTAEIAQRARAALAGFPADLPPWLVYACHAALLPPASCDNGLTANLRQFLGPRNEVSITDVNRLVDAAIAKAPVALQPLFVARDTAVLRATAQGDFLMNFLAVRQARADPQLQAAVNQAINDCFNFGSCTVDDGQLVMLAIASADLPLPSFLASDFVDCTQSVCSDAEQQAIIAYLQARIQANQQFQAMIDQMRDTTREVAQNWWRALAAVGTVP